MTAAGMDGRVRIRSTAPSKRCPSLPQDPLPLLTDWILIQTLLAREDELSDAELHSLVESYDRATDAVNVIAKKVFAEIEEVGAAIQERLQTHGP